MARKLADLSTNGPINPRRCKAHKKTGEQCKRAPIRGSTVCRSHGGAARQVREKAERQLLAARDSLMAELLKIAHDEKKSPEVRLKAITWGLERAGFRGGMQVEIEVPRWQQLLEELTQEMPGDRPRALPSTQDSQAALPPAGLPENYGLASDAEIRGAGAEVARRAIEGEVVDAEPEEKPPPNEKGSEELPIGWQEWEQLPAYARGEDPKPPRHSRVEPDDDPPPRRTRIGRGFGGYRG